MKKLLQIDSEEFRDDVRKFEVHAEDIGYIMKCLCDQAFGLVVLNEILPMSKGGIDMYNKWKDKLFPKQLPVKAVDSRPIEIIRYLNAVADTDFRTTAKKNIDPITARLKEGYTVDDFKRVIDVKVTKWLKDQKMIGFIRPETLFGNKFEGYLNEKVAPASKFEQTANVVLQSSISLKEKFAHERLNKNRTE